MTFCKGPFFDTTTVWHGNHAQFSACFVVFLEFIPSAYMITVGGVYLIFYLCRKKPPTNGAAYNSRLAVVRQVVCVLLILATLLGYICVAKGEAQGEAEEVMPVISAFAFVLALLYMLLEYHHGQQGSQSTILVLFFVISILANIVPCYQIISDQFITKSTTSPCTFGTSLARYILLTIELLLFFIPDGRPLKPRESPYETATLLSRYFVSWYSGMAYRAFWREMDADDICDVTEVNSVRSAFGEFQKSWKELEKPANSGHLMAQNEYKYSITEKPSILIPKEGMKPSIYVCFLKCYWPCLLQITVIGIISGICSVLSPAAIALFLQSLQEKKVGTRWHHYVTATIFLALNFVALSSNFWMHYVAKDASVRLRSAISAVIYEKALYLSADGRNAYSTGTVVNLMSVDANRISNLGLEIFPFVPWAITILIGDCILLGITVRLCLLVAITCFAFLILVIMPILWATMYVEHKEMTAKDHRIQLLNEAIQGIKLLKMYAWEKMFADMVCSARAKELGFFKQRQMLSGVLYVVANFLPFFMMFFICVSYLHIYGTGNFTAPLVFLIMNACTLFALPMFGVYASLAFGSMAHISAKRIQEFLHAETFDNSALTVLKGYSSKDSEIGVQIRNGAFSWSNGAGPFLRAIELEVGKGQLAGLVGHVGCGKSALMSTMIGEMYCVGGDITLNGQLTYVPQQSMIQNKSLRDNILFGKKFDEVLYWDVVEACCLTSDLASLPNSDLTEIGERGVNLSGGQRQRIGLARAVYQNVDIYLLDDPLSAVDVNVDRHIFEHVIGPRGLLKGKTRLLSTHRMHHMAETDIIYVMSDGRIKESGSYKELNELSTGFIRSLTSDKDETDGAESSIQDAKVAAPDKPKDTLKSTKTAEWRLIEDEVLQKGNTSLKTYWLYWKNSGWFIMTLGVSFALLGYAFNVVGTSEMSSMVDLSARLNFTQRSSIRFQNKVSYTLMKFCGFNLGSLAALVFFYVFIIQGTATGFRKIYSDLTTCIFGANMQFFDSHPFGRIVNRFSTDVEAQDRLLDYGTEFLQYVSLLIVSAVFVSITAPVFLAFCIPMAIAYVPFLRCFMRITSQSRRLESITRSPIYCHTIETLAGLGVIRSLKAESRFLDEYFTLTDENARFFHANKISRCWFKSRVFFLSMIMILGAMVAVLIENDDIGIGMAGLCLTTVLLATELFTMVCSNLALIETSMVGLERMREYSTPEHVPQETCLRNPNATADTEGWPTSGKLDIMNIVARYQEGLPPALRDINASLGMKSGSSGERIGIVGRTGSGKSTLTMVLLRLLELESGSIEYDDVDISTLGLHDLRDQISILPQEPMLFTGSIRFNLDPSGVYTDDEIWSALEGAYMAEFVRNQKSELDFSLAGSAEDLNLSFGERQLLCLSRLLLRRSKLVILDEATANVDPKTDELVMQIVRERLRGSTVLVIAHRLESILDCDRVIVMDNGEISELGSTVDLLADNTSSLYTMANAAGLI